MIFFSEIEIEQLIVHSVGNKLKGDSVLLSDSTVVLNSEIENLLLKYFITPFKSNEYYNFSDVENNELYFSIREIFSDSSKFALESKKIATRLFEEMRNPKVSGGNLFVVFFKKCIIGEIITDAIGIFKADVTETFLKIKPSNERFVIDREAGINITKMTKACLIFNYEEEDGYLISVIDKRAKNEEISYWSDNFLDIESREDEYFQTKNTINCIENFVMNELPENFEISKADQIDLLNKTLDYFKSKENFLLDKFSNEVFENEELVNNFGNFKTNYEKDNNIEILEDFLINKPAVKKQTHSLKSTIKLDDKFDIIIHKDKEHLLRGKDEATGLNYYQLFFNTEN